MDIEGIEGLVPEKIPGRVQGNGQGAQEDRQGIENPEKLHSEEGGGDQGQQKKVFYPSPRGPQADPAVPHPSPDSVQGGAEGTDPAAEEAAEEGGEDQQDQGRPEQPPAERPGGESVGQGGQWIDAEKKAHRPGKLVGSPVLGLQKEPEKAEEAGELNGPPAFWEGRGAHQTIRTFRRSVVPRPCLAAAARVGISRGCLPKRVAA